LSHLLRGARQWSRVRITGTPLGESVADASFAELRALYEGNDRRRVPVTVFNALLDRKKTPGTFSPPNLCCPFPLQYPYQAVNSAQQFSPTRFIPNAAEGILSKFPSS